MPIRFSRDAADLDATRAIGLELAQVLSAGDVVILAGELGAGKTTLARAIAEGLGHDPGRVSSPTFVIVTEHHASGENGGRLVLIHADAYRLTGPDDLDVLGWDRLIGADAAMVIEWGDRIAAALPPDRVARIELAPTGPESRRMVFELPESWSSRELSGLAARPATTCPITGEPVPAGSPTYPFSSERARHADLYRWMAGKYAVPSARAPEPTDAGADSGTISE